MNPLNDKSFPMKREYVFDEVCTTAVKFYDFICYVNVTNDEWFSFKPSACENGLSMVDQGSGFFINSSKFVHDKVHKDDQGYVLSFFNKDDLLNSLRTKSAVSVSFRFGDIIFRMKVTKSNDPDYLIFVFENINDGLDEHLRLRGHLQQYDDFINGLAYKYDALYSLDLKNDVFNVYAVSDELADIKTIFKEEKEWFLGFDKFVNTLVLPEYRDILLSLGTKEHLGDVVRYKKKHSLRFLRYKGKEKFWMELVIIKNEKEDEQPEFLAVGLRNIHEQVLNEINQSMLLAAVRNHFSIAIAKDITNNSYRMIEHGNFVNGKVEESGTYDELLEAEVETVPEGEQRERFLKKFKREHVIEAIRNKEKSIYLRHQQYDDTGEIHWIDTTIIPISFEEPYLAISLSSSADENQKQIDDLQEALRQNGVYYEALKANTCATMEVNLSTGIITNGPYEVGKDFEVKPFPVNDQDAPYSYDAFEKEWVDQYLLSDHSSFLNMSNCDYLLSQFRNGNSYVEIDCKALWTDNTARDLRETYYISQKDSSKDVIALCVLYDFSESVKQKEEIRALTSELEDTRVKVSSSQMNPHFLYNALASIQEVILEDPQYASDLVYDFTTHLRACVKSMSSDALIPFSQELNNIEAYTNIEKMRFGNRLKINYEIQHDDFMILPLSIQPLVENAIRHGIYPLGSKGGEVTIKTFKDEKNNIIQIIDNGVGFDYEKIKKEIASGKRDSTGLNNLTFRLDKVLKATVKIDSTLGEGSRITVAIPFDRVV